MLQALNNFTKKIKNLFLEEKEPSIDENIEWQGDAICLKRKQYPTLVDDHRLGVIDEKSKSNTLSK